MTISVFMVAEKPSICTSIAQALSKNNMTTRGRTPPVHEFTSTFMGQSAFIRVTSVTGHVFSVDFPKQYQNWDSCEPSELFDAPIVSTPEGKGGIVKHLEHESKNMDYLVLWLDCDREGENICFEVIRCVEKSMNLTSKNQNKQYIYRAKFSAVTPKDIENAMKTLTYPNENESKAVEARQELDLKVGVAFSRFQTKYFQGKYGDLDSSVISYGPCQTPTLGFCVNRYDEIQTFLPEPFWNIDVTTTIKLADQDVTFPMEWSRGRIFDQSVAETFMHLIQLDTYLICESIKSSETRKTRPQPLNTVEMLKLASSKLGIGPHSAMKAAEELYLSGYLSYPRTESTMYPTSYNIRETLQEFRGSADFGDYVSQLLKNGHNPPKGGVDMGDHPPITPVSYVGGLIGDKGRLYDMIVRHFLATVSEDARYMSTKLTCKGIKSNELFILQGRKEINPGFLAIYNTAGLDVSIVLPEQLREGDKFSIKEVKLRTGKTTPPDYLSESELIGMMEKHGIGTDASIATHINNIIIRNYVSIGSGRTLVPTALGVQLVHGYLRIDPALVLPEVRAAIESFCNLIAKGQASKEVVVAHSLKNFTAKFQYFCHNIQHMDSLFEASFSPLAATGKFLSKCGKCLRYMRYIPLKPQRLYCQTCEETYSLPQNGTIKLYKEYKCPLDKFELVLYSLGNTANAQGKSYPLCPYCYNHPPHFKPSQTTIQTDTTAAAVAESSSSSNIHVEEQDDNDTSDMKVNNTTTNSTTSLMKAVSSTTTTNDTTAENDIEEAYIHDNMGCDSCMHPTCKHSAVLNGICECPGANASGAPCEGLLVLDVNSKPNWKLSCNSCNTLLRFKGDIHDITPLVRQECDECGIRLLKFEFSKKNTPLKNNEVLYTGCIVCDDFLTNMTEIILGRSINITVARQLRHRRGANSRRGRGRGRGKKRGDPKMSFSDF